MALSMESWDFFKGRSPIDYGILNLVFHLPAHVDQALKDQTESVTAPWSVLEAIWM